MVEHHEHMTRRVVMNPISLIQTHARLPVLASIVGLLMIVPGPGESGKIEQPHVQLGPWASDLKVGPGMNAVGKQLKGSRFVCQDLQGAVFDGCDLDGVEFHRCDLSSASFKGATLTGVVFTDCNIEGADFSDAIINGADLRSCYLSDSQLRSTRSYRTKQLHECTIYCLPANNSGTPPAHDFRNANLFGAVLVGDFTRCNFSGASIKQAELSRCVITSAQLASTSEFQHGRLWGGSLSGKTIRGRIDFSKMELLGTRLYGPFQNANFDDATISHCHLTRVSKEHLMQTRNYRNGDLSGVSFTDMDLSRVDFSGVNLTGAQFWGFCDFTGTVFEDAVITGCYFEGYNRGLTFEQIKSTWNYKHGRMAGIQLPDELARGLAQ